MNITHSTRLVSDLFPGLDPPLQQDENLLDKCATVCAETGLQAEDSFLKKTVQLQELIDVRHSVMLIGPAGCGKTTVWKTLQGAHNVGRKKPACVAETINPKSVTSNELYGYMTLQKDWKDGVISIIMRNMTNNVSLEGSVWGGGGGGGALVLSLPHC